MSKKCPVCGSEVPDDAKSCPNCGAELTKMDFETKEEEVELDKLLEDIGEELEEEVEIPEIEEIGGEEDILGEIENIVSEGEDVDESLLPDIDEDIEGISLEPESIGEEEALSEIEKIAGIEESEKEVEEKAEGIITIPEEEKIPTKEGGEELEGGIPPTEEAPEIEEIVEEKVEKLPEREVSSEVVSKEKAEEVKGVEEKVPESISEIEIKPEVEEEGEKVVEEKAIIGIPQEKVETIEEKPPTQVEIKPEVEEVAEEKVEEEAVEEYVCPMCGRDIPPEAEECPYCGVVFGLEILPEEVLKNLLQYIKQLIIFAKDMKVDVGDAMKYIKEAWELASKEEYEEGIKRLVDARILLERSLSNKLKGELNKYKKYLSSEAVKIVYDRVNKLLEERKFIDAFKEMDRLKEVSKPMKIKAKKTFKKLKELSETIKIAKRFGIEVEDIENLLNRARKDFSEGKFNDVNKKINTANKRLESRVEEGIKPILATIKNYILAAQIKGIDIKPMLAKVREFKYASEEKNVQEMLNILYDMNSILKEWGLVR